MLHRASYAQYRLPLGFLFSLALACGAPPLGMTAAQAQEFKVNPRQSAYILYRTNEFREGKGRHKLRILPGAGPAQQYAEFLARNDATGHTADGRTPAQRVEAARLYAENCGIWENVADYWSEPNVAPARTAADFAMNFWKKSPGHRENLERANAKVLMIGEAGWTHGGKHYYKFVQVFVDDCRPSVRSDPIKKLGKRRPH